LSWDGVSSLGERTSEADSGAAKQEEQAQAAPTPWIRFSKTVLVFG